MEGHELVQHITTVKDKKVFGQSQTRLCYTKRLLTPDTVHDRNGSIIFYQSSYLTFCKNENNVVLKIWKSKYALLLPVHLKSKLQLDLVQ